VQTLRNHTTIACISVEDPGFATLFTNIALGNGIAHIGFRLGAFCGKTSVAWGFVEDVGLAALFAYIATRFRVQTYVAGVFLHAVSGERASSPMGLLDPDGQATHLCPSTCWSTLHGNGEHCALLLL